MQDWTPEKGNLRTSKASAVREHEPITVARLERALAFCAHLMTVHGDPVAPLFERLERELAAMRQTQNTVERAKRLLENLGSPMQCKLLDAAQT